MTNLRGLSSAIGVALSFVLLRAVALGEDASTNAVNPCNGSTVKPGMTCPGEETDPKAAVITPTIYAWTVFAQINQPAFPSNKTDTRRIWETWKSADDNSDPIDAIYLDNGHEPQAWNVKPREALPTKRLVPIQQLELIKKQNHDPSSLLGFVPNNPLAEEVRVNRPAFNFILENHLYNRQGQYQYASTHPAFDFPTASKEIKAIWLEAASGDVIGDYYSAKLADKTYILVAMHVITKDVPFWHWASFVHKDKNKTPQGSYVAPLASYQEVPESLKGTPFANYRLLAELVQQGTALVPSGKGAQLDWITRSGEATILGNPQIERGFANKSSCITCHAHASIGSDRSGRIQYNSAPFDIGPVKSSDFNTNGVIFYPLDFIWSLSQAKNLQP